MVPLVQPVWLAGQLVQVALMPPREIWFVALQLTHTRLLLRPWPLWSERGGKGHWPLNTGQMQGRTAHGACLQSHKPVSIHNV